MCSSKTFVWGQDWTIEKKLQAALSVVLQTVNKFAKSTFTSVSILILREGAKEREKEESEKKEEEKAEYSVY